MFGYLLNYSSRVLTSKKHKFPTTWVIDNLSKLTTTSILFLQRCFQSHPRRGMLELIMSSLFSMAICLSNVSSAEKAVKKWQSPALGSEWLSPYTCDIMPSLCDACGDESYSGTADGNPIDSKGHVWQKSAVQFLKSVVFMFKIFFKFNSQKVWCRQIREMLRFDFQSRNLLSCTCCALGSLKKASF